MMRNLLVSGAKVAEIVFRPSQRWRRTLLQVRLLIDRLDNPSNTTDAIERQLKKLVNESKKHPEALHPTALQLRRVDRFSEALALTDAMWNMRAGNSAAWSLACAKVWYENAEFSRADLAMAQAKRLDPDFLPVYVEEARNHDWRGNASIARDAAEHIIQGSTSISEQRKWSRFVALQEFKFGNYDKVISYAADSGPKESDHELLYVVAVSLERNGDLAEAASFYDRAEQQPSIRILPEDARRAALHIRMGFPLAALAARSRTGSSALSADARLAFATAAIQSADYELALEIVEGQTSDPKELAVRALALELMGDHVAASMTYRDLLRVGAHKGDARSRIGERFARAAAHAGRLELLKEAESAFALELPGPREWKPEVDPRFVGEIETMRVARSNGSLVESIPALRRLLDSTSDPENYQRLARLLTEGHLAANDAQAFGTSLEARPRRVASIDELLEESDDLRYTEHYSEMLTVLGIRDDVILYESFHGAKISCNPLALCLRLLERDVQERWTHVWAIRDGVQIPPQLEGRRNVRFVRFGSYGYQAHLATAGFLINNVTFPQHFVRREGQRYLNTWHGVPWKHLGRDFAQDPYSFFNIARNLIQATHIVLPDEHTAQKLIETQDVDGLSIVNPLILGSPRVDRTLGFDDSARRRLLAEMSLDETRPTLFYAPTWRGAGGDAEGTVKTFLQTVSCMASFDVNVVVRVHHLVESELENTDLPSNVVVAPLRVDTNELLGLADVLVSDYSSLIFDFATLNRPIVKYVFDLEDYRSERGLYFRTEEVPGIDARNVAELKDAIEGILEEELVADWTASATAHVWSHEDGNAANRTLDAFLSTEESPRREGKNAVLVATGGLNPNGITRSLRNLFSSYVDEEAPLRLMIPRMPLQNPEVASTAAALHERSDFTVLTGLQTGTRRERFFWRALEQHRERFPERMLAELRPLMQRERKRHLGEQKFKAVVDFESYTLYNSALCALGFSADTRSVAVLHSEFGEEMRIRFPKLRSIGSVVGSFSALTSVSPAVLQHNQHELQREFEVSPALLKLLPNTIDVDEILELSREPLESDLKEWFGLEGPHVVAVGRLSTEKNPAAMIQSLRKLADRGEPGRLLFVGDGPLRQRLDTLVRALKLSERVMFAGQRSNPYPAIANADALMMSSLHEGQPMVLLEALTLGTPAVSSDIPGARAVLQNGSLGLLVPAGAEGLERAWGLISSGELPQAEFDAINYQRQAVEMFKSIVGLKDSSED